MPLKDRLPFDLKSISKRYRTIFKDKENMNGIVMPFYNGREYGLGLSMTF